jgi:hypothetical protein
MNRYTKEKDIEICPVNLLDSLLTTYNLFSTVNFPTRIRNGCNTAIDIFINIFTNDSFSVCALTNGLSDHDAQVISLSNFNIPDNKNAFYIYRKINTQLLNKLQLHLSYELWEDISCGASKNGKKIKTYVAGFVFFASKLSKEKQKKTFLGEAVPDDIRHEHRD